MVEGSAQLKRAESNGYIYIYDQKLKKKTSQKVKLKKKNEI